MFVLLAGSRRGTRLRSRRPRKWRSCWGWGYAVVTGWRQPAEATVDAFSAQRRPLADPLGIAAQLLDEVGEGSRPFGELVAATSAPMVGRAFALHLLWHRRLGMDLSVPLTDRTLITAAVR